MVILVWTCSQETGGLIFVKDQQSFTTEKKVLIQEGQRINLGDIRISQ